MKLYSIKPGFKKARTAANLTQQQLADKLNVSLKTVMNWEQGIVTPSLETTIQIADLLHCDIDFLTGRIQAKDHDTQFIMDRTGLSEEAIDILSRQRETSVPSTLSRIICHRLFVILIRSFEKLITRPDPSEFKKAVIDHIVNNAPYTDSPEDIEARNRFEIYRTLSNIADDLK